MKETISFMPGSAYPLGVYANGNDLKVSARYRGRTNCGICLFSGRSETLVLFDESCRTGNLYSAVLKGANGGFDSYLLYEDGVYFCDPYARKIIGLEKFGIPVKQEELRCKSVLPSYDWRGDIRPLIPYADSLLYCLNVRAFTKQASSGVPHNMRGTFRGLVEKIPYLKSLGVTAVELLPVYEIQTASFPENPDVPYLENGTPKDLPTDARVNLWGFDDGYYFAPRSSYATAGSCPCNECKDMIHAFHENGMEVILQFYFTEGCSKNLMIDCIRYWVSEYHIDGIHLKSENIPVDMIASDPMLSDLKILSRDTAAFPAGEQAPRYLSDYGDTFTFRARRFLKGDDLSIGDFVDAMFTNFDTHAAIHYICNYDGFTLRDLVTYEHKQNLENGENNTDGRNDNYSWNCGFEGESRKKAVRQLRKQQMLNALSIVLLSGHTPLLYAGDEMGNTQSGNNNPYCQDNKTGWTDWDKAGKYADITAYVRFLSCLRKRFPVLRTHHKKANHAANKGYPPVSFHGAEAWRPDFSDNSHSFAVLYCDEACGGDASYLYVIYNMYWNDTVFALPSLPKPFVWKCLSDTSSPEVLKDEKEALCTGTTINVNARSILVLEACQERVSKRAPGKRKTK